MENINKEEEKNQETEIQQVVEVVENTINDMVEQETIAQKITDNSIQLKKLYNRISEYYDVENWNKLIEGCNQILELDSTSQIAYIRRGTALGNLGKFSAAAADFEKAIQINFENPDAHYNLGIANLMLKKNTIAIDNLKNAILYGIEDQGKVYSIIANIYNELSDDKNYLEYAQKASNYKNNNKKTNENNRSEAQTNNQIVSIENKTAELNSVITNSLSVFSEPIHFAEFSTNAALIALSTQNRKLKICTQNLETVFSGEYPAVAMAFNEKYLALGGHGVVKVLNVKDNFSLLTELSIPQMAVKQIFFHPRYNTIVYVSDNYNVWKVDFENKSYEKILQDFKLLNVSSDRNYIIGKDYFNNIKIFRIDDIKEIFNRKFDNSIQIKTATLIQKYSVAIIGDKVGKIIICDLRNNELLNSCDLKAEILQIETGNSEYYAVMTNDRKIRFFDTKFFKCITEFSMNSLPKMFKLSNSGNSMAICGFDGEIKLAQIEEKIYKIAAA